MVQKQHKNLELDLGYEYKVEEIRVHVLADRAIKVEAEHFQHQFFQEFCLLEPVHPCHLQALLSGRVLTFGQGLKQTQGTEFVQVNVSG